ncbi:MAG TPA: hypothetical protein VIU44_15920 [Gaiellaceae bacterium]
MNKNIVIAALAALLLQVAPAIAQSGCPAIYYGNVLTAAQWNACFSAKQDALGFTPLNRNGDTMIGRLVTAAPGASTAGFNLAPGSTPASPANGDIWATVTGLYARIGGQTFLLSANPSRVVFYSTVDFNAAGDTAIALTLPTGFTRFIVTNVRISGASHSLTTATAGLFTGTSGTGVAIVTAASAITVSSSLDATNNNAQAMTVNNADTESYTLGATPNLYFRVATPEGAAATGTVSVSVIPLP